MSRKKASLFKMNKLEDNEELTPEESENSQDASKNDLRGSEIIEMGSVTTMDGKHPIHCLTIIGQIEGHYILSPQSKTTKYEHVIPQLVAFEQSDEIKGLLIILNTVGGDVEAGLAIAELISGLKKPTVSLVLGGGHSIGVPLACSAKYSFIVPSATMTIHPVRTNGVVLGVPQMLHYLERMQDRIITFVTSNSKMKEDRFREFLMNTGELVMDIGSTLEGSVAVDEGLIDQLGGLSDAVNKLYEMIEKCEVENEAKNPKADEKLETKEEKKNRKKSLSKEKKQKIKLTK